MAIPSIVRGPNGPHPEPPAPPLAQRPLVDRLFPVEPLPDVEFGDLTLAPPLRPAAELSVLDITEFFGETSGGIRTYLLEKAGYVEARPQYRHVLLVPGGQDAVTQSDGVRVYRLKGPRVPRQHPYRFMLATRSTRRVMTHERPAIIEVGSPGFVPWLTQFASRGLEAPLVYFYHSHFPRQFSPFPDRDGAGRRFLSAMAWRYAKRLDRLFALTIAASDYSVRELAAAGIDRVVKVPLGVDLRHFHPGRQARRTETRARLGLPDGPLAMFVGRFAKEKELDVLVRAWADVERTTDCTLVLVGDGPRRPLLEALAAGRRRVRFVPYQTNREAIADTLAAADFVVAPSAFETFGLSALEALASGVPLLSTNRGATAEHVLGSGAGLLFEAGEAAAIADGVRQMLRADLPALGRLGRAHAEAHHDWRHVFDRLFAVYRDVLATR
jgi:alpha-1,6-mannosyltransferase